MMCKSRALFWTYLFVITGIVILVFSCKKEDDNQDMTPFVFTELIAEKDTILPGQSTGIMATASGDELSYTWSASAGDILGSGKSITYISPPCTVGNNQISCTVRDKYNHSETKTITIVVL